MKKDSKLFLLLFLLCILSFFAVPSVHAATIVIGMATDTANVSGGTDTDIALGDTFEIEIWIEATDTWVAGCEISMNWNDAVLQLVDKGGDSFAVDSPGIQIFEDHTVFNDIFFNQGDTDGVDTMDYAAQVGINEDTVMSSFRVAVMEFKTVGIGQTYIEFNYGGNRNTVITSGIDASDVLTGTDSGSINVTAPGVGNVVIAEILNDPPAGAAGDANKDGTRDAGDDDFAELYNDTNYEISLNGWSIATKDGLLHTFGAVNIPAYGRVTVFGGGDVSNLPGLVFVGNGGDNFTSTDTCYLVNASGDTVDTVAWTSGPNQSWVRPANYSWPDSVFLLHSDQADTADSSLYSPATRTIAIDGSLAADITTLIARPGDQDTVAFYFNLVGSLFGDTLTYVELSNLGSAPTDTFTSVELWASGDEFLDASDTLVGYFKPDVRTAADTDWYNDTFAYYQKDLTGTYIVVVDFDPNATNGQTLRLRLDRYGCLMEIADSGPMVDFANVSTLTISDINRVTVTKMRDVGYDALIPGDTNVTVMAVTIAGDPTGDTLTEFSINSGNGNMEDTGILSMKLYADDGDSEYTIGEDTFVCNLTWNGSEWNATVSGCTYYMQTGSQNFIVVVDVGDSAIHNDSFQGTIESMTINTEKYDSGAYAQLQNTNYQYVVIPSPIVISEIYYDVENDPTNEFIELRVVNGPVDPSNWHINDWDAGGDFTLPANLPTCNTGVLINIRGGSGTDDTDITDGDMVIYDAGMNLSNTGDPITLKDNNGYYRDFVTYEGGTDVDLAAVAPEVFAGWPTDGTNPTDAGGDAGSNSKSLYLNGSDLNDSSNWIVLDHPTLGRIDVDTAENVLADTLYVGDTKTVIALVLEHTTVDTPLHLADTLTDFALSNIGSIISTELDHIGLYKSGDTNWDAGDSWVADLTWNGDSYVASNINWEIDSTAVLIVAVNVNHNVSTGDDFQAVLAPYSVASRHTDSGPFTSITNPFVLTAENANPVVYAETVVNIPALTFYAGDTNNVAFSVFVRGDGTGDTIDTFSVASNGTASDTDFDTVQLWIDANNDSQWDTGDTLVAVLTWNGNFYDSGGISLYIGTGETFIITGDIPMNPNVGETVQLYIPARGIEMTTGTDSGPVVNLMNPYFQTIQSALYDVSGTVTLEAIGADSQCTVWLYTGTDTYSAVSVTGGTFVITGVPAGVYSLRFKEDHHLALKHSATIAVTSSDTNIGTYGPLSAGDANNDNIVNIYDASIVKIAKDTSGSNLGYEGDINRDGSWDVQDLAYVRQNFRMTGDDW